MKRLIVLIACVALSSCISTNIPKNEKRAKKRLSKHLTSIKNITNTYPSLTDTFTTVKYDTITIKSHSIDTSFIAVHDTSIIDSLISEFVTLSEVRNMRTPQRVRTLRNQIIKEVLKDTVFTYEDSLVHSTFIIKEGKFYYKSTVKEQKKPFKTEIINNIDTDCNTRKNFWSDWKFWVLLIIWIAIYRLVKEKRY
jgi:hypothetical protein